MVQVPASSGHGNGDVVVAVGNAGPGVSVGGKFKLISNVQASVETANAVKIRIAFFMFTSLKKIYSKERFKL
jgi:hypothetical protein